MVGPRATGSHRTNAPLGRSRERGKAEGRRGVSYLRALRRPHRPSGADPQTTWVAGTSPQVRRGEALYFVLPAATHTQ
jgi:hypothetical protein